jgi:hypothetical protein
LKKLTTNFQYLYPKNIHNFFPKLEHIVQDIFSTLDQLQTKNFLSATVDLKCIEFSSDGDFNKIIPQLQKFKYLEFLSFSNSSISLSQFVLLMNVLNLHSIKFISLDINEFSFEMIAPFFKHLIQLEEILISFWINQDINRIMIESQMMTFLNIISSLEIKNTNLHIINLIANINNNEITIPNHRQRMSELRKKFPKLKTVQLGWGFFKFPI